MAFAVDISRTTSTNRPARALALGAVLILARTLALTGRTLPISGWTVPALIWQDVAVAVVFWLVDRLTRRSRWMWIPYASIVALAAIDVPVTRALSSPLTVPMLRGAGGAISDSIRSYLTFGNVAAMLAVAVAGAGLPFWLCRVPRPVRRIALAAVLLLAAFGPIAATQVDLAGMQRNAVTALVATIVPRAASSDLTGDWRTSPFGATAADDLTQLRATARGFNVLLISLESTASRFLKPYGAADDPMPTLSSLADRGLVFDPVYAVYPESIKGLFSTMCSRVPGFDTAVEVQARQPCPSLATTLSAAGYRTALFHSGWFDYLGMKDVVDHLGFSVAEDAGAIGGPSQTSFGVDEPSTVARLFAWIDSAPAEKPFFSTYLPIAGHHPYVSPEPGPFHEPGDRGAYKNALHYSDRMLAQIIDGLRTRNLADRTLLVLFGDHGEAFGEHEGNYGHTQFIYEENVRVPLVIAKADGSIGPLRIGRTTSLIDVAPTVLELVGVPAGSQSHGHSLLDPTVRMAYFFTDYAVGWTGLRDGCWKFILEVESKRAHLYDVCRDSGEMTDRVVDEPARAETYRRWMAERIVR